MRSWSNAGLLVGAGCGVGYAVGSSDAPIVAAAIICLLAGVVIGVVWDVWGDNS